MSSVDIPRTRVAGYPYDLVITPGQRQGFHISAIDKPTQYRYSIVRLISGETDPETGALPHEEVQGAISGSGMAEYRKAEIGSYGLADYSSKSVSSPVYSLTLAALPTSLPEEEACLVEIEFGAGVYRLSLLPSGALHLIEDRLGTTRAHRLGQVGQLKTWHAIALCLNLQEGAARFVCTRRGATDGDAVDVSITPATSVDTQRLFRVGFAAATAGMEGGHHYHFDGKLDLMTVRTDGFAASGKAAANLIQIAGTPGEAVGFWPGATDMSQRLVENAVCAAVPLVLYNLPKRAATGWHWDGTVHDWRLDPAHYSAIHFHNDDIVDADWPETFAWHIPESLPSGVYAALLETPSASTYLTFFVTDRTVPEDRPAVAYLAPTASYLAYANYRLLERGPLYESFRGRIQVVGPEDMALARRQDFGHSAYEQHDDGSGVSYSSSRRPILNLQPNTRLSGFSGDMYVVGWLEATELDYALITDHDLHNFGAQSLKGFRTIVTGAHPEYWSGEMIAAMEDFVNRGGRLMYMGGNGAYWRISFSETYPTVIEVRRTNSGVRAWHGEPGENSAAFDGMPHGLWRDISNGYPNRLFGVGYSAIVFDIGAPYRIKRDNIDSRTNFVFEGISGDIIGDHGRYPGGAAGQEVDRYDVALGSPPHAVVLASSTQLTDNALLEITDLPLAHKMIGGTESDLVRADMVFFETMNGGAVFSTGSISFASSLPTNEYDNDVARVCTNVLLRFIDSEPFADVSFAE